MSLEIKIVEFDQLTGSLLVKFRSPACAKPIDEYRPYAFQPASMNLQGRQALLRALARFGEHIVAAQVQEEQFDHDRLRSDLIPLVGTTVVFGDDELATLLKEPA